MQFALKEAKGRTSAQHPRSTMPKHIQPPHQTDLHTITDQMQRLGEELYMDKIVLWKLEKLIVASHFLPSFIRRVESGRACVRALDIA